MRRSLLLLLAAGCGYGYLQQPRHCTLRPVAVDAVIAIAIAASAYPLLELANQPDEQGHVSSTSSLILIYPVAGTGLFGASALDSYWSYRRCQDITREEERYRRVDHSPGQTSGLSIGP